MIIRRAHVYRLYPTKEQAERLTNWVGAVRAVYNVALEQRKTFWKPGRRFNFATQGKDISELRADLDWIRDVPSNCLHQALRDLDKAYKNWWAGKASAPTFRKKGANDRLRFSEPGYCEVRRLSRRSGDIRLPKMGCIKLRWDRAEPGIVKNITIVKRAEKWFASLVCEVDAPCPEINQSNPIGLDRGITVFAALSDGTLVAPVNFGRAALHTLARAQRSLARKTKGSQNRKKQISRIAKLHARVSSSRKDFLHKTSTNIAKSHGIVVIENLRVQRLSRSAVGTQEKPGKNVRQKSGLNRVILDQGWGMFRTMLSYKLAERGGQLIEVPAEHTSRTCSVCGAVDSKSRKAAKFCCVACGHEAHADTNAAINILKRGQGMALLPVEASDYRADEAGTIRGTI